MDEEPLAYCDYHDKLHPDSTLLNKLSGQIIENTVNRSNGPYANPWKASLSMSPSSVSLQSVPSIPPSETKPTNVLHSHSSLTSFNQSDVPNNQGEKVFTNEPLLCAYNSVTVLFISSQISYHNAN